MKAGSAKFSAMTGPSEKDFITTEEEDEKQRKRKKERKVEKNNCGCNIFR